MFSLGAAVLARKGIRTFKLTLLVNGHFFTPANCYDLLFKAQNTSNLQVEQTNYNRKIFPILAGTLRYFLMPT